MFNGVESVMKYFEINSVALFTKKSIKIERGSIANSVRKKVNSKG